MSRKPFGRNTFKHSTANDMFGACQEARYQFDPVATNPRALSSYNKVGRAATCASTYRPIRGPHMPHTLLNFSFEYHCHIYTKQFPIMSVVLSFIRYSYLLFIQILLSHALIKCSHSVYSEHITCMISLAANYHASYACNRNHGKTVYCVQYTGINTTVGAYSTTLYYQYQYLLIATFLECF